MAGELVSFGIQKLWDLLSQEYAHFRGVEDQVTELKTDLNRLKSFLKDADAKKHKNTMVRNCVEEIKEIIYDAEDILETFILREQLRRTGGIKMRIGKYASSFVDRKKFASDMGGISKRISKVILNMQSFGIVQQMVVDGNEYSLAVQERLRVMRREFAGECENDLVGLEANIETLVGYLMEEDNVQVVSVIGMGGLGKTTLARQAFNHDKVKSKFDRLAWVCVTREFNRKFVWQTILKNFKTKEEEGKIMQKEEDTLQVELFQLLETSKSLIVIDDIWEQEHWDQIRKIFPTKKEFDIDEEMKKMGMQMVEHCGGLPLAVRVLGGLLAAKYTPHDWERLYDNIGSHIMGGRTDFRCGENTSLNYVLSLSFAELPSYLKFCFLYLAHFPEDYKIDVETLSYNWVAEGILKPRHYDKETIRDVGESYIEELVKRNMVISKRNVRTLRFETCQLHDMMRELCLSKAKEENFLHFLGMRAQSQFTHSQSSTTSRRFVLQMPATLHAKRDINNPNVRSLVVVLDNSQVQEWKLSSLNFTRLQLLRVLHIPEARFEGEKLPYSIGELIHLRYLNLESVRVSNIPSSLGNLKLLIYLNINVVSNGDIFVPNILLGMKDLRYLALPSFMHLKTKLELSKLVELETLINFSTYNLRLEDLHGMSRLRTLRIDIRGERGLETLCASIGELRHLENLSIEYYGAERMKEEDAIVLDFFNLKEFKLVIAGPLSDELHFSSCLTGLSLYQCSLKEDPMPILEKLLHLKEVYLKSESFLGRRMVCSVGGFPHLQKLEFSGLKEWEEWIVEEYSMKLLHTLIIDECEELKELPIGLKFITSLKHLKLFSTVEAKWEERLSEEGEDYYKIQHVPSRELHYILSQDTQNHLEKGD